MNSLLPSLYTLVFIAVNLQNFSCFAFTPQHNRGLSTPPSSVPVPPSYRATLTRFIKSRPFVSSSIKSSSISENTQESTSSSPPHCPNVLFVECGFGNDSHGQDVTKAAIRSCRNAIEFNSLPSIKKLVPGGYDGLKLDVILAVPKKYQHGLDLDAVSKVFPYGECRFTIQDGGMVAPSGIAIDALGDKSDDMVVVCCAVTVGY